MPQRRAAGGTGSGERSFFPPYGKSSWAGKHSPIASARKATILRVLRAIVRRELPAKARAQPQTARPVSAGHCHAPCRRLRNLVTLARGLSRRSLAKEQ